MGGGQSQPLTSAQFLRLRTERVAKGGVYSISSHWLCINSQVDCSDHNKSKIPYSQSGAIVHSTFFWGPNAMAKIKTFRFGNWVIRLGAEKNKHSEKKA